LAKGKPERYNAVKWYMLVNQNTKRGTVSETTRGWIKTTPSRGPLSLWGR